MATRLRAEVIENILADRDLFAHAGKVLDIRPISLYTTLKRNNGRVNEYDFLKSIADYLGTPIEAIIEEVPVSKELSQAKVHSVGTEAY